MDLLDIIILAAAGVGLVAFVVLAVVILRQGRSIRTLEDRIGPPVPAAAAPSLERVRAVAAQAAPSQSVEVAPEPGDAPAPPPASGDDPSPSGDPAPAGNALPPAAEGALAGADAPVTGEAAAQTARQAEAARKAAREDAQARKDAARAEKERARSEAGDDVPTGRGLQMGAIAIVVIGLLSAGGWYLFIRDDGTPSAPATASTATTATSPDAGGEVPEDIPPLANKAAYTVAVLNASNITGAAANKVAPRVQADGYTLGVVDNASKQGLAVSEVQYVKGRQDVAWNLARDLGITTAVPVNALSQGRIGTADAVVVVGTDLAK